MTQASDDQSNAARCAGSSSYLVRVLRESASPDTVRFYLRDLKTGDERYLGDSSRIGEVLIRGLRADRSEHSRHRNTA